MEPLIVLSRILHVLTAVLLTGGAMFTWLVLMPAARGLPDEAHEGLRERIGRRWRKIVMIGIVLLLITGFYNYLGVAAPQHKGDGHYHMLMGIKMMLALPVFFFASALAGRSKGLQWVRRGARKWLGLLVMLSVAIISIAGYLKVRGVAPGSGESSASTPASDNQ